MNQAVAPNTNRTPSMEREAFFASALNMCPDVTSTEKKIDLLRTTFGVPFFIRGTSTNFDFRQVDDTSSSGAGKHAYFVDPLYPMTSREWTRKLQATLHAASSRAMHHSRFLPSGELRINGGLPMLMVFGPNLHDQSSTDPIEALQDERKVRAAFRSLPRAHTPYRESLEVAIVHGERRQTFQEDTLKTIGRADSVRYMNHLLFTVAISEKEYEIILTRTHQTIRGAGFDSPKRLLDKFGSEEVHAEPGASEQTLQRSKGLTKWEFTHETSFPGNPILYLVSLGVSQLLTSRFCGEALKICDKLNLPKDLG